MQGAQDEAASRYMEMVQEVYTSIRSGMMMLNNSPCPEQPYAPFWTVVDAFKDHVTGLMRDVARLELAVATHGMTTPPRQKVNDGAVNDGPGGRVSSHGRVIECVLS